MAVTEPPSRQNPVEFVPWWIESLSEQRSLLVVAWADNVYRKTTLRTYANKVGGIVLDCRLHTTKKRFLQWFASECGLFPGQCTYAELYDELLEFVVEQDRLVIFDEAQRLSVRALDIIKDFHHEIDDRCRFGGDCQDCTTTFVLTSGAKELVEKLDRVSSFWAYCFWQHFDVPLSAKQSALLQQIPRPDAF